jgi:activator of Hsp90 ATPase-like protein
MDVRPGGIWRFVQRDSDGNEYILNCSYHEIVPPKRLVYTFEFEGMPGYVTVETVTFEEEDGSKTRLPVKLPSREVRIATLWSTSSAWWRNGREYGSFSRSFEIFEIYS